MQLISVRGQAQVMMYSYGRKKLHRLSNLLTNSLLPSASPRCITELDATSTCIIIVSRAALAS